MPTIPIAVKNAPTVLEATANANNAKKGMLANPTPIILFLLIFYQSILIIYSPASNNPFLCRSLATVSIQG